MRGIVYEILENVGNIFTLRERLALLKGILALHSHHHNSLLQKDEIKTLNHSVTITY